MADEVDIEQVDASVIDETKLAQGEAMALARAEVDKWLAESRSVSGRSVVKTQSYSVGAIASAGIAFEPIAALLAGSGSAVGGCGLYFAHNIPEGAHLAEAAGGFIGAVVKDGSGLAGQARFVPVPFDPVTMGIAVAMLDINKKLDAIQEAQQKILDYLISKDRAEDRGNLTQLVDVLESYQFNSNDANFRYAKLGLVQDIRRKADQRIEQLGDMIKTQIDKRKLLHLTKDAAAMQGEILSCVKDYQFALYSYSFATLLEVLLIENYDSAFLASERGKIEAREQAYRNLCEGCRVAIESYADSAVQARALGGAAKASKFVGKVVGKTPVGDKTPIDEAFGKLGEAADGVRKRGVTNLSMGVVDAQETLALPFAESILILDHMRNNPVEFMVVDDLVHVRVLAA